MRPVVDNTEAEFEAFATVCGRLAGFDEELDAEWVDGFLTAVAAGPLALPTERWLPALCGDAFERAFADPEDEARGRGALEARLQVLRRQLDPEVLLDEPDAIRLSPYLLEETEPAEAGAPVPPPGLFWAAGFLTAQERFEDDWQPVGADDEALELQEELFELIGLLCLDEGSEALAELVAKVHPNEDPSRDDLIAGALLAAQDLRVWWLDFAPRPPTRHAEARPGRNDPCPCGSGRKYKRCHGA